MRPHNYDPDLTDYMAKRYRDIGRETRDCDCRVPVVERVYSGLTLCRKCGLAIHPARLAQARGRRG